MRIVPLLLLVACAGPKAPGDSVPDDSDALADSDEDTDCEPTVWFADDDADGYGARYGAKRCEAPPGSLSESGDCDDGDAGVHPGATETCDDVDQDCDGEIDEEAVDPTPWHPDVDRDGFGDPSLTVAVACDAPGYGVADGSDCDDADAAVNPAATEWCNGWDDDCDGLLDRDDPDNAGDATWYADADGDGWGVAHSTLVTCIPPSGWASHTGDCNDTDSAIHPGAEEAHGDEVDDDCDSFAEMGHTGAVAASEADAVWTNGSGPWMWEFATLGDVDGDGQDDFALGAPCCSVGAVYFVDGAVRGTNSLLTAAVGDLQGDWTDTEISPGNYAGAPDYAGTASYAGDPDFDGVGELWIGASGYDDSELCWDDSGAVYLVAANSSGSAKLDDAYEARLVGRQGDGAGMSVASAGDVDGDGREDVAIGANGRVYVVYGPVSGSRSLSGADVTLGGAGGKLAGGQDIDGDGLPDVIVGSPSLGTAYVVSDPSSGTSDLASYPAIGGGGSTGVVGSPGDLDDDGYADVLTGSSIEEALVFLGPVLATTAHADVTFAGDVGSGAGQAVAGGDVDEDGVGDVLIGGLFASTPGHAWLIYGPITAGTFSLATDADATFWGDDPSDHGFGSSVAVVGDADADGLNDILIGGWDAVWLFTAP